MVDTASKTGFISQIIGPVVDIEFPGGELPRIYNALVISSGEEIVVVTFVVPSLAISNSHPESL